MFYEEAFPRRQIDRVDNGLPGKERRNGKKKKKNKTREKKKEQRKLPEKKIN